MLSSEYLFIYLFEMVIPHFSDFAHSLAMLITDGQSDGLTKSDRKSSPCKQR